MNLLNTSSYLLDYTEIQRLETMGSNRVNGIYEVETVWKHVPGSVNPDDIATIETNLLSTSIKNEWFNRPQFLRNSEYEWSSQEHQYYNYFN